MVKHTQTIRRQIADELFEYVWSFCEIGAKKDYGLALYSIPSLTLLVHPFTLFTNHERVVLEISCFVYIINVYFDIYGLFVS